MARETLLAAAVLDMLRAWSLWLESVCEFQGREWDNLCDAVSRLKEVLGNGG